MGNITFTMIKPDAVAECDKCGWWGSSSLLDGGGQIADTGDHFDCTCPVCGNPDIGEKEEFPCHPTMERVNHIYKSKANNVTTIPTISAHFTFGQQRMRNLKNYSIEYRNSFGKILTIPCEAESKEQAEQIFHLRMDSSCSIISVKDSNDISEEISDHLMEIVRKSFEETKARYAENKITMEEKIKQLEIKNDNLI